MRSFIALFSVATCLAGCGGGGDAGPERYDLSGTVTFDGKPVERGTLYIEPTPGNPGPVGFVDIVDGKYDTATSSSKGHIGGKVLLRVVPMLPPGKELVDEFAVPDLPFASWEEQADLPKETTTKDIAVPKNADAEMKKRQVQSQA